MGLDLSYTSSGVVVLDGEEVLAGYAVKAGDPKQAFYTRMSVLWTGIQTGLQFKPELVAIEGAAYDKVFKAFDLGQLNGVIKYLLVLEGYNYIEIPPTSARKIAVGNGGASKEETAALIEAKFGYKNNVSDIIDAFVIAKAATIGYSPKLKQKAVQRRKKYIIGGNSTVV
jgi:Holliday junction resolvasome RuvABC endonuclease subunit